MAQALILDSEAVYALANAGTRTVLANRSRAILKVAHEERALVRVPAPVLAEVCRGGRYDARVSWFLGHGGVVAVSLTPSTAARAGGLLARAKLGSAHAVDGFVVATALEFGSAIIAAGDPDDISLLAAGHPQIRVFAI